MWTRCFIFAHRRRDPSDILAQNLRYDPDLLGSPMGGADTEVEHRSINTVQTLVGSTSGDLPAIGPPCVADPLSFFGVDEILARKRYSSMPASTLAETLGGNNTMNEPTRFLAGVMTEHGQQAWLYRFSYVRTADRTKQQLAPHGSDNSFAFVTVGLRAASPEDSAMANTINTYYANFALHGNPNGPGLPLWKPFEAHDENLMDFTSERGAAFERDPIAERIDLINPGSRETW